MIKGCGCVLCASGESERGGFSSVSTAGVAGNNPTVFDYTALLSDFRINEDMPLSTPAFVTFTFLQGTDLPPAPTNPSDRFFNNGYTGFTAQQQANFREALARVEAITGITFIEVADPDDASIQVMNTSGSNWGGWANYPFSGNGILVIDGDNGSYAPGTWQFETILHEIGHALGLKHPFEGPVILDPSLDNDDNTLMSYTGNGVRDEWMAWMDVQALNHFYGPADGLAGVGYFWDEASSTFYVTGTFGNDAFTGIMADNWMDGGWGDDVMAGRAGDDTLLGGEGNDTLIGTEGTDFLYGQNGDDIFWDGDFAWDASYFGQAGNDYFDLSARFERVDGGEGFDTFDASERSSSVFLDLQSSFNDVFGIEQFIGTAFRDTFRGDWTNSIIDGGAGGDSINGRTGFDLVSFASAAWGVTASFGLWANAGDAAGDTYQNIQGFIGSLWADALAGDAAGNYLDGSWGDDYIWGGDGADSIFGGVGNDTLLGGAGFDSFDGGAGWDYFAGGGDANLVSYASAAGSVVVELYANRTSADGSGTQDQFDSIQSVFGSWYADWIYGDGLANTLWGSGGADTISAGWGDDIIYGGTGGDVMTGSFGNDYFSFAASELVWGEWDYITDFGEGSGNFDYLQFTGGLGAGDIQMFDYFGSVYLSTTALGFNGGIVLQNTTVAALQDQMLFA